MVETILAAITSITAGRIILIAVLTLVALWINRRFTEKLTTRLLSVGQWDEGSPERERRIATLTGFLRRGLGIAILVLALLSLLPEFGVEIAPLITAAGIGGLAIGFGAQNLVKDVISGFFFLLEDQIRVGDWVEIDQVDGLVESLNLRTTVLRDLRGVVHVIPNGSITHVSNMTKEWARAVVDVGVAYKEDADNVMDVLRSIGQELQADSRFATRVLGPLEVLGINEFADSAVVIRTMMMTRALEQWSVARELRRRIKKRFDELDIEIPFPHRTLYWGDGPQSPPAEDPITPRAPSPPTPRRRPNVDAPDGS